MTASSAVVTTLNKLRSQMENINGEAQDYYFNMSHDDIKLKYESMAEVENCPAIRITSPVLTDMRPTDQVTYEGRVSFEIFGYVEASDELIMEAMKLFHDIEKAILANPELDNTVWGLAIDHFEAGEGEGRAGVLVRVSSMLNYDTLS